MTDLLAVLSELRRPRLLMQAARHGIQDYCRNRDLSRLTRSHSVPTPTDALPLLIREEQSVEETRRRGDASYSIIRHIDLLIAILAEARLLPRAEAPAAP